jgi:hypothetical protein
MSTKTTESKNLLIELAKRKAAAEASGNKFGILGKDLSTRYSKGERAQSYIKRGGRNGSGKP